MNAGQTGPLVLNVAFPWLIYETVDVWADPSERFGFDIAFRVVTEHWAFGVRGGVTLVFADNSRGYPASLELIGPTNALCLQFEHYLDGITFTPPQEYDFTGEVVASWENVDARGAEIEMKGPIEDGIGVFTCDTAECPEGECGSSGSTSTAALAIRETSAPVLPIAQVGQVG